MTAASAGEYPAVRLFVERATALGHEFALTDDNAATVGSICQRLDGIPLAIELAVPRLKVLSVQQLARGLDERFRLLTGGSRTALPRQQTLHALIDWSYGLLSDPEKLLLGRLSVFLGGTTLASITAVVAGAELPREQVGDLLLSLVEKSLVHADLVGNETRYRLLESTRYFASEKLGGAPRPAPAACRALRGPARRRRRRSGRRRRRSSGSRSMKPISTICAAHWSGLSRRMAMPRSASISSVAATCSGPSSA